MEFLSFSEVRVLVVRDILLDRYWHGNTTRISPRSGHAKVYVIATGQQLSVQQFVSWSAQALGITLRFEGQGIHEVAVVEKITGSQAPALQLGQTVVRIDQRYFRPTEVDTLLGDPTKAQQKLGWVTEITAHQMCQEMVASDLQEAKRHALLKANGIRCR